MVATGQPDGGAPGRSHPNAVVDLAAGGDSGELDVDVDVDIELEVDSGLDRPVDEATLDFPPHPVSHRPMTTRPSAARLDIAVSVTRTAVVIAITVSSAGTLRNLCGAGSG